jgi:hypothetical protein
MKNLSGSGEEHRVKNQKIDFGLIRGSPGPHTMSARAFVSRCLLVLLPAIVGSEVTRNCVLEKGTSCNSRIEGKMWQQ